MSAQITFTTTVPRTGDTQLIALQKILQQLRETTISGGAGSTASVTAGHGAPSTDPGVSAALYYDLDTNVQYQWNDESGAWV